MELANELLAGLRGMVHTHSGGSATLGFDWSGLHSRFAAEHAARAELARSESPLATASGSFAAWRLSGTSPGKELPGVNRTDSADRKAPSGKENDIAGTSGAGDRGQ